jgi:Chaperone of endosialidase
VAGSIKLADGSQSCNVANDTGMIRFNSATTKLQYCVHGSGWQNVAGTAIPAGSDKQVQYNNGGALAGSASLTCASSTGTLTVTNISYSGLLVDTSDRRAKDDIEPLPPGQLEKLMRLQPVSFVMKNDPQRRTELGLIAQDVQPLYPEIVQTGDNGMKSMAYVELVAPLIKAMQEQQAEIKTLWIVIMAGFSAIILLGFCFWRTRKV